ncbi:MAG: hypothetical protein FWD64_13895 [Acidobacteriaceae bacterium]|nr:hypothetical protein [Acidobacteriaceae bacterium]
MLTDWSAECGHDDPVLVVPWSDPGNPAVHFVDLREHPYDVESLPEAVEYPPLARSLRALNGSRSPVFTAKCDVSAIAAADWDAEARNQLDYLHLHLDRIAEETPAAFVSYIDIVSRDRAIFASRHRQQQMLDCICHRAAMLDHPYAMLELVLRPAIVDFTETQEGFAFSLYIKALGHDVQSAEDHWAEALKSVTAILRSKAFSLPLTAVHCHLCGSMKQDCTRLMRTSARAVTIRKATHEEIGAGSSIG